MITSIPGLKIITIPFNGAVNEISASTKILPEECLKMINWRTSKDGTRIEKRGGLSEEVTNFVEDLYGYTTYYDTNGNFCQVAVLESQIKKKVGAGVWTSIHTFSVNLTHPVKILEIHGKIFIIQETESRMIHRDGNDYQIGIGAPATLPTLTAGGGGAMTAGIYRYAVTYARSGDFGNESNPIKSIVGDEVFTGTGLDDCDISGSFTGTTSFSVRVKISTAANPDLIDISYDGGATWATTGLPVTKTVYLNYGIILTFGAVTGHILNDYWQSSCSACTVTVTANQRVTLTSIPISSDSQVNKRNIYRTTIGGSIYYWLISIENNTSTTFVDNIFDAALGAEMEEDHDVMPNGKFSCWWDNRLWVSGNNIIYYSEINVPEEFDTDTRYIIVRTGDIGDEITQMIDYGDTLYIFKRDSIFGIISRSDGTYGRHLLHRGFGCVSPWSMIEVNGCLMWHSFRGIEIYCASEPLVILPSAMIDRTLKTIDSNYYNLITSIHVRQFNEVWFSFPDRTGGNSAITAIFNYSIGSWYFFEFYKIPSCLIECRDSNKTIVNKMGTRDGYLCLCESGYKDGLTTIIATVRKGWIGLPQYADWRRVSAEFEVPTNNSLTCNLYVNFDKDIARTATLTGVTPSATDIELRRPIFDNTELGLRAKYLSLEFVNSDIATAAIKINEGFIYYRERALKGKISAD
jgi:hypothetical protein